MGFFFKVFIVVIILKLVEDGFLDFNVKVFGKGGIFSVFKFWDEVIVD